MHTYTPADSIFAGPVTNLLSVLWIWVGVLSRAHAKSGESLNDFKFGSCISRFSSDAAASTAVKGLSIVRTEKKGKFWHPKSPRPVLLRGPPGR